MDIARGVKITIVKSAALKAKVAQNVWKDIILKVISVLHAMNHAELALEHSLINALNVMMDITKPLPNTVKIIAIHVALTAKNARTKKHAMNAMKAFILKIINAIHAIALVNNALDLIFIIVLNAKRAIIFMVAVAVLVIPIVRHAKD